MSRVGRRKNKSGGGMLLYIFIVDGSAFLIMVHPLIFFLVVLPLAIWGIVGLIKWLKK